MATESGPNISLMPPDAGQRPIGDENSAAAAEETDVHFDFHGFRVLADSEPERLLGLHRDDVDRETSRLLPRLPGLP